MSSISIGLLTIEYLAIDLVHLYPRNARRHLPRQIGQIARSIESFGFVVPILVDRKNEIVAGHGRYLAAQSLGRTEVPVIRLEHLTEAQARALAIADNRLTDVSVWDDRLLGHENWEVLSFPAVAEQDETHVMESVLGTRLLVRKAGEALHPERESLETLAAIRSSMTEYNFAAEYQQRPIPLGGAMVRTEWLKYYDSADLPERFSGILQSWDPRLHWSIGAYPRLSASASRGASKLPRSGLWLRVHTFRERPFREQLAAVSRP